jgi:soluble lytic murein transglycosylase-like protein
MTPRKGSRSGSKSTPKKKANLRKGSKAARKKMESRATARLPFDDVKALVRAHKKSPAFTDECVIAICWKESSFDPSAQSGSSTAKGLMQMTNPAVDTVNNITPPGVHFEYSDMLDASKAIECGTYYLQWCSDKSGGDEAKALDKYAGVSGYSANVMQAETCLLTGVDPPTTCLGKIHSFRIERRKRKLVDDRSGESRFSTKQED